MYLSVVIPAYNEEKRIEKTLKKVKEYLGRQKYQWEVIVVSDGSKDETARVVTETISRWSNFRLIDNKVNQGKGGVVKQGMLEARGEWRLFMDADNSTDVSEVEKLWPFTEKERYEIVIGSRYLDKSSIKIKQPLLRRLTSRIGNFLVRTQLGINMVDTQCGFKLFSAKASEDIFPKQTILRWGFDMEILAIAIKKGYKIKEVPVAWYDAEGSHVQKGQAIKTLKELWAIKKNLMRGKYS